MTAETTVVKANNLRFQWSPKEPEILHIAELHIGRGEHIFIKGPSGSGKTTLLNLLGGILQPSSGQITLLDQPVSQFSGAKRDKFRADHIGVIFQMFNLVPYLSVVENVLLPCRFSKRRRKRAMHRGRLEQEARHLLARLGLQDEILQRRQVTQLSQGQQQRVAAARALIGRPEILLADEPTSSLDIDVRIKFLDLMFSEADAAGTTVIFVSHDNLLQEKFSRVIALNELNQAARHRQPEWG